jgi:hypothetical protein
MTRKLVREYSIGQMAVNMKDHGLMESKKEKDHTQILKMS